MTANDDTQRVVIAVTESSNLPALWRAAMQVLNDCQAELVALFVDDDRWHRAASLPFTREFSRLGGAEVDFTTKRAEQIKKASVDRAEQQIKRLAADANLAFAFEVWSEKDQDRIREVAGSARNLVIAPSFLASQPIYAHIQRLDCRIMLVETTEEYRESPGLL